MAQKAEPNHGEVRLSSFQRLFLSFLVGIVVLSKPLMNGMGIDLEARQAITSVQVVLNVGLVVPLLVLALSVFYAYVHPDKKFWDLFLDAAGIPGLLLAGLLHVSK